MKKNRFLILLTGIVLFIVSCQNDNLNTPNNEDNLQWQKSAFTQEEIKLLTEYANGTTQISEETAKERALEAVNSLSGVFTKAGLGSGDRTIKNIHALKLSENNKLKRIIDAEEVQQKLAYIVNFEDDRGYAIISADIRIPQDVIACTVSGNLELEDETENEGLIVFLEGAEEYMEESIQKGEIQKDSLANEVVEKLLAENPELAKEINTKASIFSILSRFEYSVTQTVYSWENIGGVSPLTPVEWDQGSPYNLYTKSKGCGGNAPYVGCVAVATAQIMQYWKYPTYIDNYYMDWNNMGRYTSKLDRNYMFNNKWTDNIYYAPKTTKENIARLMERIGANVGMKYSCDAGSADSNDAIKWLKRIGYLGGEKSGYDFSRVKSSLDNRRIVYARGNSHKKKHKILGIKVKTTYSGGHAWNYDGYINKRQRVDNHVLIKDKRTKRILSSKITTTWNYQQLVHVNWGWGGSYNGFYVSGAFDCNKSFLPSNTKSSDGDSGQNGNYQYNLEIFTNLRR